MKNKTYWIAETAVMIALLVALQWATKPLGQFVTGSCVNLVLGVSTLVGGVWCGAVVAIAAGHRRVPAGGAVLSVLTAMVLALAVVVPLASRCSASRDVTLAMPRLLAPEE